MTHGIDTDFLVSMEIRDHRFHASANRLLDHLMDEGHDFALAPQTLAEFLHIVTDPRRMPTPLTMTEAVARARHWWNAREVVRVFPEGSSASSFLDWVIDHRLGRKRLLDTLLAATMQNAGIRRLITNNESDFRIFGVFEIVKFDS